ncbi:unnamed protein product [Symbiodinium natans]|uniref:Uncharacterized protein n=1 Tax=Symbiodinium natans TaxID=878477 RepID=A0A812ST56_9DINO|nr:unnamed protein product [Symbiodinium natans]
MKLIHQNIFKRDKKALRSAVQKRGPEVELRRWRTPGSSSSPSVLGRWAGRCSPWCLVSSADHGAVTNGVWGTMGFVCQDLEGVDLRGLRNLWVQGLGLHRLLKGSKEVGFFPVSRDPN